MLDDIVTTDEDEIYRIGSVMSKALIIDIIRDPHLIVKGYEIFQRAFSRLEKETEVLIADEKLDMDPILAAMRCSIVEPLNRIKNAAATIQKGEDYNPLGLGVDFGCFISGYIQLRSHALEYQKRRVATGSRNRTM